MKQLTTTLVLIMVAFTSTQSMAREYKIDTKGAHASINFKVQHLGYSWLTGRFDTFEGGFYFDEKDPQNSKVAVEIDTSSINSNHAARDKHLRGAKFLNTSKFPTALFESTSFDVSGKTAVMHGNLTLHGVTRAIDIDVKYIGGGSDPWGGFRQGFSGTTAIKMSDFGINHGLGAASNTIQLDLYIEGIRTDDHHKKQYN